MADADDLKHSPERGACLLFLNARLAGTNLRMLASTAMLAKSVTKPRAVASSCISKMTAPDQRSRCSAHAVSDSTDVQSEQSGCWLGAAAMVPDSIALCLMPA